MESWHRAIIDRALETATHYELVAGAKALDQRKAAASQREWRRWSSQKLGTVEVEAKAQLAQPLVAHRRTQLFWPLRIEHQKATAAGADQLAAHRAMRSCHRVPAVDVGIAHPRRAPLFVLPMLVHQLAELDQVTSLERLQAAPSQLLHVMQILDHRLILGLGLVVLVAQHFGGGTSKAGTKHQ